MTFPVLEKELQILRFVNVIILPAVFPPSSLKAELRRSREQMKINKRANSPIAFPNPPTKTRCTFEPHERSVIKRNVEKTLSRLSIAIE